MFSHINSIRKLLDEFPTEQSCIEFLEERRWNGKVLSPFEPSTLAWKCKNGKYICQKTNKYFTVRTDSIFEKTKIPLRDWFVAMYLMASGQRGISSKELALKIGVTDKSAWFLAQKIRTFFGMPDEKIDYPENEVVEIFELDEACFGGLQKNRHKNKRIPNSAGGHGIDKTWVFGIVTRGGLLRAYTLPARKHEYVQPIIRRLIPKGSIIITDSWKGYNNLHEYVHYRVKDGNKIASTLNPNIHTNGVEGGWGNIKRSYNGTFNWWSGKHFQYYLNELVFKRNFRKSTIIERFCLILDNMFQPVTQRDIVNRSWT